MKNKQENTNTSTPVLSSHESESPNTENKASAASDVIAHAQQLLADYACEDLKNYLLTINLKDWSVQERFDYNWLLSEAFFALSNFNEAYKHAQEGLELTKTLANSEQSKAHYQIAKIYNSLGSIQNCLNHILTAYEFGDKNNLLLINGIAAQYYRRKNFEESQKWYERGLDICKDSTDESTIKAKTMLLNNLGRLHFDCKAYDKSIACNLEGLSIIPESQKAMRVQTNYNIVDSYIALGDIENAKKHFEQGSELESTIRLDRSIEYYLNYASILEFEDKTAEAEQVLLECLERIKQENHSSWLTDIYQRIINLYRKQKQFEKALDLSENRCEVVTEQLNHDFDKQTNFLLSKVEYNTVNQEREFYRKQSQILAENLTAAQKEAQTDALTGINNRAYFDYIIQTLHESSQKLAQPLSILMVDLDHFKNINDTYGHLVGDAVLKAAANIMKTSLRKEDVIARYGGEEFSVLLPNSTTAEAIAVAEKIRIALQDYDWFSLAEGLNLTCSIGIFECTEDLEYSLDQADKQLYTAKSNGRNSTVAFDSIN